MSVMIQDDQTLAQVQELFNYRFPFLKIDFFEKDPFPQQLNRLGRPEIYDRKMGQWRRSSPEIAPVEILGDMKVRDVENLICSAYGLRAQIFRRSGNIWLETTVTNNWSLKEQNSQGEAITSQLKKNNS